MTGIDLMRGYCRFKKYQTRIEKVGKAIAWCHTSHLLTSKIFSFISSRAINDDKQLFRRVGANPDH